MSGIWLLDHRAPLAGREQVPGRPHQAILARRHYDDGSIQLIALFTCDLNATQANEQAHEQRRRRAHLAELETPRMKYRPTREKRLRLMTRVTFHDIPPHLHLTDPELAAEIRARLHSLNR